MKGDGPVKCKQAAILAEGHACDPRLGQDESLP